MTKSLSKERASASKADLTVNAISSAVILTSRRVVVSPSTVDDLVGKIPMGRGEAVQEALGLGQDLVSSEASFTKGIIIRHSRWTSQVVSGQD